MRRTTLETVVTWLEFLGPISAVPAAVFAFVTVVAGVDHLLGSISAMLAAVLTVITAAMGVAHLLYGKRLRSLQEEEMSRERQSLQLRIEELRKRNLELEQRLASRTLTDVQVENIAEQVKPFAGQEYWVVTYWNLNEPSSLATRIYVLLTLAGWVYITPKVPQMLLPGMEDVVVEVHPEADEGVKTAATSLISALIDEGITAKMRQQHHLEEPTNRLYVNIGTKP